MSSSKAQEIRSVVAALCPELVRSLSAWSDDSNRGQRHAFRLQVLRDAMEAYLQEDIPSGAHESRAFEGRGLRLARVFFDLFCGISAGKDEAIVCMLVKPSQGSVPGHI